ncbi:MAG: flagellar biosynthesis anti-sigma factor FlgM [Thermodesulfovibrio sp.]|nr:flagellar biosynthesis anti-sigma factor FlgM [Thermodesulfovibrio sp.]
MIGGPLRIEGVGANIQVSTEKSQGKHPEKGEEIATKDQITLSETAKQLSKLMVEVSNLPDIRADKVEEIKNAINTGTYEIRGSDVAGKIIKEALIDKLT